MSNETAPGGHSATADRLDDLGIGILASPYIGKAVGNLMHESRYAPLRAIGAAGNKFYEGFQHMPMAEVAGLALVAPGIVNPLANKVDGLLAEKSAAYRGGYSDALNALGLSVR